MFLHIFSIYSYVKIWSHIMPPTFSWGSWIEQLKIFLKIIFLLIILLWKFQKFDHIMWQKSILYLPPPPLQRGCGSSLKKLTWIPFTQKVVVPTLVKIDLVVLKKTMKLGKFYYRQQQILIRKAHLILIGSGKLKIIQKCIPLISANKLKCH